MLLWAFIRGLHALTLPPPLLTPLPYVRKARTQARQLTSRCRNRTSLSSDVKCGCVARSCDTRDPARKDLPRRGSRGNRGTFSPLRAESTRCWKARTHARTHGEFIFERSNCGYSSCNVHHATSTRAIGSDIKIIIVAIIQRAKTATNLPSVGARGRNRGVRGRYAKDM